jgi:hypothetical protein
LPSTDTVLATAADPSGAAALLSGVAPTGTTAGEGAGAGVGCAVGGTAGGWGAVPSEAFAAAWPRGGAAVEATVEGASCCTLSGSGPGVGWAKVVPGAPCCSTPACRAGPLGGAGTSGGLGVVKGFSAAAADPAPAWLTPDTMEASSGIGSRGEGSAEGTASSPPTGNSSSGGSFRAKSPTSDGPSSLAVVSRASPCVAGSTSCGVRGSVASKWSSTLCGPAPPTGATVGRSPSS